MAWVVRVDDFPGLPYDSWDDAHEMVWLEWWASEPDIGSFPILVAEESFELYIGKHKFRVEQVIFDGNDQLLH